MVLVLLLLGENIVASGRCFFGECCNCSLMGRNRFRWCFFFEGFMLCVLGTGIFPGGRL